MTWQLGLSVVLWSLCVVTAIQAFINDGQWVSWLIAALAATILMRVEKLHYKMNRFIVVDEEDDD